MTLVSKQSALRVLARRVCTKTVSDMVCLSQVTTVSILDLSSAAFHIDTIRLSQQFFFFLRRAFVLPLFVFQRLRYPGWQAYGSRVVYMYHGYWVGHRPIELHRLQNVR